ncbi:hypothetical protein ES677_03575 [Bizionia gelidisalsuginis]|uniref:Uncharacterized protein n=2 Tax=Bizionia TaxID=283785 RepID=A0A8H2LEE1_9FLAO|nr:MULTISPECIES: hypothetical protein [Bizionia]TYB74468.1 hypothetical protein ES676_07265 [Bizionia saleffrena]TYC16263.1 hypothetical protein ES677_03575 [Bizionia gelidisalsuginis]
MTIKDLEGTYTIIGKNQDTEGQSYKGVLHLICKENNRLDAQWLINKTQEQSGTAFFKNDILVINFKYTGDDDTIYKGVAVYTCISKDLLDGFWSEKYGDQNCLGSERAFRILN